MKAGILRHQDPEPIHFSVTGHKSSVTQAEYDTSASYVHSTDITGFLSKNGVDIKRDPYQVYVALV